MGVPLFGKLPFYHNENIKYEGDGGLNIRGRGLLYTLNPAP